VFKGFYILYPNGSFHKKHKRTETTGNLTSTRQTLFFRTYIFHDGIPFFPAGEVGKGFPNLIHLGVYEDRFFDYHSWLKADTSLFSIFNYKSLQPLFPGYSYKSFNKYILRLRWI
jgi:hypothetical protein